MFCFQKFQFLCSKSSLLQQYGERMVRLSTANTYSYRKGTHTHTVVILEGIQCSLFVVHYFASYHLVDVRFEEFVDLLLRPQSLDTLGSGELCLEHLTVVVLNRSSTGKP